MPYETEDHLEIPQDTELDIDEDIITEEDVEEEEVQAKTWITRASALIDETTASVLSAAAKNPAAEIVEADREIKSLFSKIAKPTYREMFLEFAHESQGLAHELLLHLATDVKAEYTLLTSTPMVVQNRAERVMKLRRAIGHAKNNIRAWSLTKDGKTIKKAEKWLAEAATLSSLAETAEKHAQKAIAACKALDRIMRPLKKLDNWPLDKSRNPHHKIDGKGKHLQGVWFSQPTSERKKNRYWTLFVSLPSASGAMFRCQFVEVTNTGINPVFGPKFNATSIEDLRSKAEDHIDVL